MRLLNLLIFFPVILFSNISAQYIWPIDGKILLNSNFAECRHNHFHAGIDLWAVEGKPIKAIEDGHIWHISVNPFGYGKSLFLKLDDGRIVVYAHLQKFSESVEKIVELEQKRRFSYRVSTYHKKEQLIVKKCELVGYVGRTGAQGAHLHFEMRDSSNRPINPLSLGYVVNDSTPPLIKAVQFTPLDDSSFVSKIPFPVIIKPYYNGVLYIYDDTVSIIGRIGIEVLSEDYQNDWSFRLNIWKTELYLNGELLFRSVYNRFSYAHTKEVELEFDYDLYNRGLGRFHRLYIYGNNHLPFYIKRDGIIFTEGLKKINEIKIVCYDANKNKSVIIFYLRKGKKNKREETDLVSNSPYIKETGISFYRNLVGLSAGDKGKMKTVKMKNLVPIKEGSEKNGKFYFFRLLPQSEGICSLLVEYSKGRELFTFNYNTILKNRSGIITSIEREFMVIINDGELYEDLYARVRKIKEEIPEGLRLLKGAYIVEPCGAVFKKEIEVAFSYTKTSSKKIGVYKKLKDEWLHLGGIYNESKKAIVATSKHLGTFALLEDNVPPEISDFQTVKEGNLIEKIFFTVKDIGTGFKIADIHITLDGVSYIPFYDLYRNEVCFLLFKKRIEEGGHTAKIKIKDRAGNKSSLSVSF
ncbi:MAG: M23 family metallopeptidase [Candidatus Cloacimonadota bacterium]|nr:MAG: M23 family metallopeptidase [Candidatus Cloacimonadota bacterium]